jgi:hypothetical protein
MTTWADKTISASLVKGLAGHLLHNRLLERFDAREITAERTAAAKAEAARVLTAALGSYAAAYESRTAMLDALSGSADLAEYVDMALAYAFVAVYAWSQRHTNDADDLFVGDHEKAMEALRLCASDFGAEAPRALSLSRRTGRHRGGGSIASTMSSYDTD